MRKIVTTLREKPFAWFLFAAVVFVFAWLVIRDAWLCDDAFITLRVVDNFHNGHGLRWNIIDRVQVFTHPLWCFALLGLGGVFGNLPLAALLLSIVLSITAFLLIVPRPGHPKAGIILLALLIPASKAVTQFATSGLEGPLATILLAMLLLTCGGLERSWERYDRWVPLIAAAIVLTRADLILIVAPLCVAWVVRKGLRPATVSIVAGVLAVATWELFTLVYYGSLVPNTAHAKLDAGVPFWDKTFQAFQYFQDFTQRDPAGFIALGLCLILLATRRRDLQARAVGAGIALYLLYIVGIGGDFMSGRFFAVPVFFAVAETGRVTSDTARSSVMTTLVASIAALFMVTVHLFGFNGFIEETASINGISDERMFYAPALSLSAIREGRAIDKVMWVRGAKEMGSRGHPTGLRAGAVGLAGYYGGPNVHVLDVLALGDPLLSRLPSRSGSRIGHFERQIPEGYERSLLSRSLVLEDPDLNEYCRIVWSVTRGPVWSASRFGESLRLISGSYDTLVDGYLSRSGTWLRNPGLPTQPPAHATIELYYVPERPKTPPRAATD